MEASDSGNCILTFSSEVVCLGQEKKCYIVFGMNKRSSIYDLIIFLFALHRQSILALLIFIAD